MAEKIIRFSRLLRIFRLNNRPAYIIELEDNNKKTLYVSYSNKNNNRVFEKQSKTAQIDKFKQLSDHCLMNQCTDATGMFCGSPLTHFEADCFSLVNAHSMFYNSPLCFINTKFTKLKNGNFMFLGTKITEMNINFPKLILVYSMFAESSLEKITSKFPLLENGFFMFGNTPLKEINCYFPKIKDKDGMFDGTPPELKQNCPQYFV